MKAIYTQIKEDLELRPTLRERRFSRNYLMEKALKDSGLLHKWMDGIKFSLDDLLAVAVSYDSWRHEYGKVLLENKDLRGEDYGDGKKLADKKKIDFGYEVGFREDRKLSDKLF